MKALKPLLIGGVIAASPFVAMHGASATHASWDVTKACQGNLVAFTVHVTNSYTETLEFHYATMASFFGTLMVAPGQTASGPAGTVAAAKDTTFTVGVDTGTKFVPSGALPVGLTPTQMTFQIHQGDCGFVVATTTTTSPPPSAAVGTPTSAPPVATTVAPPTPTAPSVTPETATERQSPPRTRVAVPVTGLPATCLVQSHCSVTANGDAGILSFPVDGHGNLHGVLLAGVAVVAVGLVLGLARHGRSDTTAS